MRKRHALLLFALLLSLLAGFTAVSRESLWIDEANSALKATQPSLISWWNLLVAEKGSDLQMPVYMLQLWAWTKFFGASEFALRSVNILWLCLGQGALTFALRRTPGRAILLLALSAASPILWYYLNDARPYLMQYAGACLLGAVLFDATRDPRAGINPGSLWAFSAGLIILCGSSLLGVIWAAGAVGGLGYLSQRKFGELRSPSQLFPIVVGTATLALLGAYYFWTLSLGTGASSVGSTSVLNLAFITYELLGAAGLGPGRLQIRENGFEAFRASESQFFFSAFILILAGTMLIYGVFAGLREVSHRARIAALICALPTTVVLVVLGYWQHFRLLGRHFMPILPVILALLTIGIFRLWATRKLIAVSGFTALLAAWLISSLSLRFCERHRKDDYREAARVARDGLKANQVVWWSADRAAAFYYHVPITSRPGAGAVTLILRPAPEDLRPLAVPDFVIASKPDIYDGRADALGAYLVAHQFLPVRDLPAFTIWRKAAAPSEPR